MKCYNHGNFKDQCFVLKINKIWRTIKDNVMNLMEA